MPSHNKLINIIELSVYFVLEVLCPFDLAHAGLLNKRHYMFIQCLQQKLNGSKCIELVCTLKWKLKTNKRQICIMTQLCVQEIGQLVNSSKARYDAETVLSKSIGKQSKSSKF